MLHLQEKSCLYKKILRLQENLAKARNLCICNKILQKQEYLSTKCKGAIFKPYFNILIFIVLIVNFKIGNFQYMCPTTIFKQISGALNGGVMQTEIQKIT